MKQSIKYRIVTCMLFVFVIVVNGCGSNTVNDSSNNSANAICENIAGTWWITDTIDASSCGEGTQYDSYEAVIKQNGCDLTVSVGKDSFSGSITGSTVSWTGSYSSERGTVTINAMDINKTGNRLSGSANWTLNDVQEICSGATEMSGTKI